MLTIPSNVQTIEFPTSTLWIDESGIVYSISKKAPVRTVEEAKKTIEEFKRLTGNKKLCMLIDVTNTTESSREVRNYAAEELPKIAKAIAMVSNSALGKMLANLFFRLKSQPYPVKMFTNEKEAKKWLMQFLAVQLFTILV